MAIDRSLLPLTREVLDNAPWLGASHAQTRDDFIKGGTTKNLGAREVISRRGEPVDALLLIIHGNLEMSITDIDGRRHVAGYLEAGQITNLIPLLDERPAIHDICAHNECIVFLIPKPVFTRAVESDPGLSRAVLRLLCLRSRIFYDRLADVTLLPLRARCARALLSMLPLYGQHRADGISISLKLSQNEFADIIGASRQSVNRELKRLEKEDIIRMTYSRFIVIDDSKLHSIATEHY
ncbi:MAG TPA: Crp/Fnr family transcriptional regulator [Rhodoblastus sp.]|nr:Crp/Fnr family transcriptional regulator [Rhodoblastus sp.]